MRAQLVVIFLLSLFILHLGCLSPYSHTPTDSESLSSKFILNETTTATTIDENNESVGVKINVEQITLYNATFLIIRDFQPFDNKIIVWDFQDTLRVFDLKNGDEILRISNVRNVSFSNYVAYFEKGGHSYNLFYNTLKVKQVPFKYYFDSVEIKINGTNILVNFNGTKIASLHGNEFKILKILKNKYAVIAWDINVQETKILLFEGNKTLVHTLDGIFWDWKIFNDKLYVVTIKLKRDYFYDQTNPDKKVYYDYISFAGVHEFSIKNSSYLGMKAGSAFTSYNDRTYTIYSNYLYINGTSKKLEIPCLYKPGDIYVAGSLGSGENGFIVFAVWGWFWWSGHPFSELGVYFVHNEEIECIGHLSSTFKIPVKKIRAWERYFAVQYNSGLIEVYKVKSFPQI
ncbi:hypothetical protein VFC49_05975 [Thermococcus sp. SY098]|uniref:hypothetical protein n=1 Tax=Thermococcus sp. SY098 TaxID=3111325 RepID=UPI002D78B9CD|nr:hypothetical protein [Thermococcus sp. SY098]WRS51653.1 hypothetical protein VFC49_05975 [Thermococcus sp. SY098]